MRVPPNIFRSPIGVTAALSVAVLVCVAIWQVSSFVRNGQVSLAYVAVPTPTQPSNASGADWQQEMALLGLTDRNDPTATSSSDTIAMIGPMVIAQMVGAYAGLQSQGTPTLEGVQAVSNTVSSNLRAAISYKTYTIADFKTDPDISYERMLTYRSDLRTALTPLLNNKSAELDLYGKYIETSDPSYLTRLTAAAKNYKDAAANTAALSIPRDAVNYHKDILNAMEEFGATLEQLVSHANDSLASAALLRAYNQAEEDMYTSFNALSAYYSQKTP